MGDSFSPSHKDHSTYRDEQRRIFQRRFHQVDITREGVFTATYAPLTDLKFHVAAFIKDKEFILV